MLPSRPPGPPRLVPTPEVVAHRGASGHRPELTLAAVREAVRLGADAVEVDVLPTRDGVLVCRHDLELSSTTDVAAVAASGAVEGLASRHRTRDLGPAGPAGPHGGPVTGWFVDDLDVAELGRLTARERWPGARPASAAHDGEEGVPTLDALLAAVRAESVRAGREVGVMVEVKHPALLAAEGHDVAGALVAALRRHGLDHPRSRTSVLCFEPTFLQDLAARVRVPLVQLVDRLDARPADLAARGVERTFGDLASREGLAAVDEYADGIAARCDVVVPWAGDGRPGPPSPLVREAHRRWLTVHAWTVRAENRHLPPALRRGPGPDDHGDVVAWCRALLDAGVDGLVADQPEVVGAVVRSAVHERARSRHLRGTSAAPAGHPAPVGSGA